MTPAARRSKSPDQFYGSHSHATRRCELRLSPWRSTVPGMPKTTLAVRADEKPWTAAEAKAVRTELESDLTRLRGARRHHQVDGRLAVELAVLLQRPDELLGLGVQRFVRGAVRRVGDKGPVWDLRKQLRQAGTLLSAARV